jgi:glutamate formiminotransferase/formiminotetrahydrofolate cyclodeaminase
VAAHVAALAAALTRMVAGLTEGRKKYADVEPEMKTIGAEAGALQRALVTLVEQDAESYGAVTQAYRLPKAPEAAALARAEAIRRALLGAARVPLETARAAAAAAGLAARVAQLGNQNAVSDAAVAALLAEAATRGAAYNVRINVAGLERPAEGSDLVAEAAALVREAEQQARIATAAVEKVIGST